MGVSSTTVNDTNLPYFVVPENIHTRPTQRFLVSAPSLLEIPFELHTFHSQIWLSKPPTPSELPVAHPKGGNGYFNT